MILEIDDKYRITTDAYNYVLQKKRGPKTNGQQRWENIGFWPTLDGGLKAVLDLEIKRLGTTSPEELIRHLHTLNLRIEAIGEQCLSFWGKKRGR